jgi:hypothetical protein
MLFVDAKRVGPLAARSQVCDRHLELLGSVAARGKTMHALRRRIQGCEFLSTGRLTAPMRQIDREYLLRVRQGVWRSMPSWSWNDLLLFGG